MLLCQLGWESMFFVFIDRGKSPANKLLSSVWKNVFLKWRILQEKSKKKCLHCFYLFFVCFFNAFEIESCKDELNAYFFVVKPKNYSTIHFYFIFLKIRGGSMLCTNIESSYVPMSLILANSFVTYLQGKFIKIKLYFLPKILYSIHKKS